MLKIDVICWPALITVRAGGLSGEPFDATRACFAGKDNIGTDVCISIHDLPLCQLMESFQHSFWRCPSAIKLEMRDPMSFFNSCDTRVPFGTQIFDHPAIIPRVKPPSILWPETLWEKLVQVENVGTPPRTICVINFEQIRLHFAKWGRDFDLVVYPVWHSKKVRG